MHSVEVIEDFCSDSIKVSVDGKILKDEGGADRTFKDSFAAGLAGAREVDRLRGEDNGGTAQ